MAQVVRQMVETYMGLQGILPLIQTLLMQMHGEIILSQYGRWITLVMIWWHAIVGKVAFGLLMYQKLPLTMQPRLPQMQHCYLPNQEQQECQ